MSDVESEIMNQDQEPSQEGEILPRKRKAISDSEDEGEDIARPSSKRVGMYSDDEDEEEDDEDGELTEADKKFIVDDDDEEEAPVDEDLSGSEAERERRRRKKKKREQESREQESDLSDDEMELIQENFGVASKRGKKLRKKADKGRDDLAGMFDDDQASEQDQDGETPFRESELYEDDLEDFIIRDDEDEEGEGNEEHRQERQRRKLQRLEMVKNLGAGHGISSDAWQEIQMLFYTDVYDFALNGPDPANLIEDEKEIDEEEDMDYVKKTKEISIKDIVEPSQLAEKMLTDKDELIRGKDIPERLQLKFQELSVPDELEIQHEANIIAKQISKERNGSLDAAYVTAVSHVLKFLRKDHFEVPFIHAHRKDYFDKQLELNDLWKIKTCNETFLQVENAKKSLGEYVVELSKYDEAILTDDLLNSGIKRISVMDDADDLQQYIYITYIGAVGQHQAAQARRRFKRSPTRIILEDAAKHGLSSFARLYNIQIDQYISSVVSQSAQHFPEDEKELPRNAAKAFTNPRFPTSDKVIEATQILLSYQIAIQPQIRSFLRRVYSTDAVVSVELTDKGKQEIDYTHEFYPFKYLTDKPVYKFQDGQFSQILAAEAQGYLKVTLRVEEEDRLVEDMVKNLCNDYVNEFAQEWNQLRKDVAIYAAKEILFPHCSKWLKDKLGSRASEWISDRYQLALEKKINVAPFKSRRIDYDDYENDSGSTVLAMSWGDGRTSTVVVMLNEHGQLIDFLKLDRLSEREKGTDPETLTDFISRHTPDIIALAGNKPNTKTVLLKFMEDLLSMGRTERRWKNDIPIMIVDDDVSRVFQVSKKGQQEFPPSDYLPLIPYCVSLGRKVQDPTLAYASLCNMYNDIHAIRLHPLQKYLTEEQLSTAIDRSFINVVSSCGVDINAASSFPHLSHTLQFVSGLGPRKAQSLLSKIAREKLESRADLVRKNLCGAKIFMNCASFIRVRSYHFQNAYNDNVWDVLDDTRIHPEDYDLARKMAIDALDLDDAVLEDDENPSQHVQELMEGDTGKLDQLLLDDYAIQLEKSILEPKRICLNEIKAELKNPYHEERRRFEGASIDETFTMLTGETDETLREGLVISGEVVRVKDRFMVCQLSGGIEGMVHVKNTENMYGDTPMTDMYHPGMAIQARVLSVSKDKLSLELSTVLGDLEDLQARTTTRDAFFSTDRENQDMAESKVKSRKVKEKKTRFIKHPFFQNLDYKAAQKYLENRPRGDIVIRPSTKGMDHISFTWKVDDGIYQHIDVKEFDKESEWSLGRTLKIENLTFAELDQVIAEYIEPMSRRVAQLLNHPKFQRKNIQDMKNYVSEQARAFKRSAYGFILFPPRPGSFELVFQHPANRPKHEEITILPSGYEFRSKKFSKIDDLLVFFKQSEASKAAGHSGRPGASLDPRRAPPSRPGGYGAPPSQYSYGNDPRMRGGPSMPGFPPMAQRFPQQPPRRM